MYPAYPHSYGAYGPYPCSAKVLIGIPCQLNILEHETHTHTLHTDLTVKLYASASVSIHWEHYRTEKQNIDI